MELSKDELITIFFALEDKKADPILMGAIANELERLELLEVDFDEDDGCAGGACKL